MTEELYWPKPPKFLPDPQTGLVPQCSCKAGHFNLKCPYSEDSDMPKYYAQLAMQLEKDRDRMEEL